MKLGRSRSLASFLEQWQFVLVLAICGLTAVGIILFKLVDKPKVPEGQSVNLTLSGKLTVSSGQSTALGKTLTSNNPPSSVSSNPQASTDPYQATTGSLQTNTNINDPNLSNNSLVQSLNQP